MHSRIQRWCSLSGTFVLWFPLGNGKPVIRPLFPSGNLEASAVAAVIRSAAEFGRAVRDRRRALGLTQEELATRCGVGKRFIVDLEAGKPTSQLGKALTAASEVGIILADAGTPAGRAPAAKAEQAKPDDPDPLANLPRF